MQPIEISSRRQLLENSLAIASTPDIVRYSLGASIDNTIFRRPFQTLSYLVVGSVEGQNHLIAVHNRPELVRSWNYTTIQGAQMLEPEKVQEIADQSDGESIIIIPFFNTAEEYLNKGLIRKLQQAYLGVEQDEAEAFFARRAEINNGANMFGDPRDVYPYPGESTTKNWVRLTHIDHQNIRPAKELPGNYFLKKEEE